MRTIAGVLLISALAAGQTSDIGGGLNVTYEAGRGGPHLITSYGPAPVPNARTDYYTWTLTQDPSSTRSASGADPSASASPTASPTESDDPFTSPPETPSSPAPTKIQSNIPAIAGGVTGGVMGAIVVAGLAFVIIRSKRQRALAADHSTFCIDDETEKPTPFTYNGEESTIGLTPPKSQSNIAHMLRLHPRGHFASLGASSFPVADRSTANAATKTSHPEGATSPSPVPEPAPARPQGIGSSSSRAFHAEDAEDAGEELPPMYNPRWAEKKAAETGEGSVGRMRLSR